jgi:hypothetical protein
MEGGTHFVWVFRVKNRDFMPKDHIFSNFRGGGGGRAAGAPLHFRGMVVVKGLYFHIVLMLSAM